MISVSQAKSLVNFICYYSLILETSSSGHLLTLSDLSTPLGKQSAQYNKGLYINLFFFTNAALFVAGVPRTLYYGDALPNKVSSLTGFQGCMGSVDINGKIINLLEFVNGQVGNSNVQVIKDCRGKYIVL